MNNLYVVESPLQALCALEVALGKSSDDNSIIVRFQDLKRNRSNKQTLEVIELGKWRDVTIIKPDDVHRNIFKDNINQLTMLYKIRKKFSSNIDSLYIGEFRYQFMHMVRCAINAPKVYLLDDGAATINVIKDYINEEQYYPVEILEKYVPSNFFKRKIYKVIYFPFLDKKILSKKLSVLTAFSRTNYNKNIKNLDFRNLRLLINPKQQKNESVVYFYGSFYSEKNYISSDYEIRFIKNIIEFYRNLGKKLIYFAHRDESEEKLNIFSQSLNIEVRRPCEMAELYLLKTEEFPSEIAGAYTSTLNNVKNIFSDSIVRSFKFNYNEVNFEKRKAIQEIYDYYESIGIKIESLDSI